MSREILALKRREDGIFEIYADGKLVEEYEAKEDTWGALLPIKLWRHFNEIVERRVNGMCKHEWLEKPDYNEKWCPKCMKVEMLVSRKELLAMPIEARRAILAKQSQAFIERNPNYFKDLFEDLYPELSRKVLSPSGVEE